MLLVHRFRGSKPKSEQKGTSRTSDHFGLGQPSTHLPSWIFACANAHVGSAMPYTSYTGWGCTLVKMVKFQTNILQKHAKTAEICWVFRHEALLPHHAAQMKPRPPRRPGVIGCHPMSDVIGSSGNIIVTLPRLRHDLDTTGSLWEVLTLTRQKKSGPGWGNTTRCLALASVSLRHEF